VRIAAWIQLALLLPLFVAAAEHKPLVVTSFLPLYSWTRAVAGDAAQVENLMSAGAEPHHYSFSQSDVRKLNRADLVVLNGLGLETWLPKWRRAAPDIGSKILDVSSGYTQAQLIVSGTVTNSHTWLDPRLACVAVSNIALALGRIAPANSSIYSNNANAYIARLQKLDAEIEAGLKGIPNRAVITYHEAFPYFAKRYGIEVAGVVEQVAGVNPAGQHLARLRQTIRERNIRAIFIGPESSKRVARQIAKDMNVSLVELDTLETGALKPESYENGMRANVAALRKALQ
jgi:zinc transport system substrate-binding protein